MDIHEIVEEQRAFFRSGETLPFAFRYKKLEQLRNSITSRMAELEGALYQDLHKSAHEAYMSEISLVLEEIRYHMKHLKRWMKPQRVVPSLGQIPSTVKIHRDPKGVVLIMSPWNYPVLLTLSPLVGAISSGNCTVLKPSAYSPASSALLKDILHEIFPSTYVHVVEGGRAENSALLKERFDHIFFTGSTLVGKVVMKAAAEYLTPVTLELGGKSPAIVENSADISLAAKRIVFGKLINAGQTCIAPDHVFIESGCFSAFIREVKKELLAALGKDPLSHPDFPRIINEKQYDRLNTYLSGQELLHGGRCEFPRIEPTILTPSKDASVMQEEIFGPLLPVITFETIDEVIEELKFKEKPLALYLFTKDASVKRKILSSLSFGGGCINDTIVHIASTRTPFGGVGASGMGSYHGKRSFMTFTHEKVVVDKGSFFDLPVRYHPYTEGKKKLLRKLL